MVDPRFQRLAEYILETDANEQISDFEKARRRRELFAEWERLERLAGGPPVRAANAVTDAVPDWAASFRPVGPPS